MPSRAEKTLLAVAQIVANRRADWKLTHDFANMARLVLLGPDPGEVEIAGEA